MSSGLPFDFRCQSTHHVLSIFTKALFFYSTKYSGTEIDREILAAALTWTSLSMDEALSLQRRMDDAPFTYERTCTYVASYVATSTTRVAT